MHFFLTRDAHVDQAKVSCCDVKPEHIEKVLGDWKSYGTEIKWSAVMTKEEKNALEKVES
jgi:hypothetical protein